MPLLPLDFDPRYFQVVPPHQQLPSRLSGGEEVRIAGMRPEGALQFEVPIGSALATLDTSGSLASLLVPVSATATFMTGGNTSTLNLVGTITLTEVPEPGTLALVSAGIVVLLVKLRQRG